jgi:hypothetical protein
MFAHARIMSNTNLSLGWHKCQMQLFSENVQFSGIHGAKLYPVGYLSRELEGIA